MRLFFSIAILFLLLGCPAQKKGKQETLVHDLPDVLFITSSSFGGFGRLSYSSENQKYSLANGRINTYIVEGNDIRLMRADEDGGSVAVPQTIVALGDKLYGTSAYSRINQYDPESGKVVNHFAYSDFSFGGSGSHAQLFAWEDSLLIILRDRAITLDSSLSVLGEKAFSSGQIIGPFTAQKGGAVFAIVEDNPSTYINCLGDCNMPMMIRETTVDFSDPTHIQIKTLESEIATPLNTLLASRNTPYGWLMLVYDVKAEQSHIELHPFSQLGRSSSQYSLAKGASVIAMTGTEPSWFILRSADEKFQLGRIEIVAGRIEAKLFPLDWESIYTSDIHLALEQSNKLLYVARGNLLVIYDITEEIPQLVLKQDFVSVIGGQSFQLGKLFLTTARVKTASIDRKRLTSILSKDYWDNKDHLIIADEIAKLQPSDEWAIPLFVRLLKKNKHMYHGGMAYSVKALERFGGKASDAIEPLVKQHLGSSYSPIQRGMAFQLIKTIDPTGEKTIELIRPNLDDAFKVGGTVELLEYISSPSTKELAATTRRRWKF